MVRNELVMKSWDAFCNGDTEKGIFYESKASYCGFIANRMYGDENQKIDSSTLSDAIAIQPERKQDHLLKYVTQKMAGIDCEMEGNNNNAISSDDDDAKALFEKCTQLPMEWNVVQLAKSNVAHTAYGTKKDIYSESRPISVTLFRHSLSEQTDNKPLNVHLDFEDAESKNILANAYQLYECTFKTYTTNFHDPGVQKKINTELPTVLSQLKLWLGPWIVLFSGKIKGDAGKQIENDIFAACTKFTTKIDKFRSEQSLLLALISRRIDLLNCDTIKEAAEHIADTKSQYFAIVKFLSGIKTTYKFDNHSYYPCILILDEFLDKMPWEMLIPAEEITRFSSIYLLFDLYDEYKHDISDGYLKIQVNTGNALINPGVDTRLGDMEKRINNFVSKWMPHWKRSVGGTPEPSAINDMYAGADVFYYAGHGSSFQFAEPTELNKMKTNAIMLLFGCESNAIKLQGLVTEPTAPHLSLHSAKCPAIFGAMCIISDVWTDMISISMLRHWIPSKTPANWKPSLISAEVQKCFEPMRDKLGYTSEPNLLRIISVLRQLDGITLRMRAAFIYRGLPVYNVLAEAPK